jgi:hypothetical protein
MGLLGLQEMVADECKSIIIDKLKEALNVSRNVK